MRKAKDEALEAKADAKKAVAQAQKDAHEATRDLTEQNLRLRQQVHALKKQVNKERSKAVRAARGTLRAAQRDCTACVPRCRCYAVGALKPRDRAARAGRAHYARRRVRQRRAHPGGADGARARARVHCSSRRRARPAPQRTLLFAEPPHPLLPPAVQLKELTHQLAENDSLKGRNKELERELAAARARAPAAVQVAHCAQPQPHNGGGRSGRGGVQQAARSNKGKA